MKNHFSIKPLPHIHFGTGSIKNLVKVAKGYGKKTLLLTGANSFVSSEHWQHLKKQFADHAIDYSLEHVHSEPSPAVIDKIVSRYIDASIDCVTAIGGGAVLDAGKAVSAMLVTGESVKLFLEGVGAKTPDGRKIPFIAIPTTSGTGSETTSNAVITEIGENGFKKSLRHDNYIPDIAIIDPELTLACPPGVTISCSLDAFSQLVESYLSTKSSFYSEDLAYGAIRRIAPSLIPVCHQEGTLDDRSSMSYGAMISGITLSNAGLGVIHGLASTIGGRYNIPHGVVCGSLMATANELTLRKLRKSGCDSTALKKYSRLGRLFSTYKGKSQDYYQDSFIEFLHMITVELKVPLLSEYGLKGNDICDIAKMSGCKNNPVQLDQEEMESLLQQRIA